jgi:hypothetical protein
MEVEDPLEHARALAQSADDEAAKLAYIQVLRSDPTSFHALNELGNLALAGGFRSAARTAYAEAVRCHPGNPVARVNLANVLRGDNDIAGARLHYEAALAIDSRMHQAHQGMAWVLKEIDRDAAERHLQLGFSDRSLVTIPYRGKAGAGIPLLLLVSARGGNIPTDLWINDRRFTIHAIYMEFYDPRVALPHHLLVVNAIGDADLCATALSRCEEALANSCAPVINRPTRVLATGRAEIAGRLDAIPGVITPKIESLHPTAILEADNLEFPLLLRRPGFHTGEHFVHVANRSGLSKAIDSLSAEELLLISYLDARGADGLSRKYRVMFVDGVIYPLHLAASPDWKVHYFSSHMAQNPLLREEERRFLEDMPGVLGATAVDALKHICTTLDLEYAGIDFAVAGDGSILVFEANATMVVFPPGQDSMWDYRRGAINDVLEAATRMLLKRAGVATAPPQRAFPRTSA